MQPIPDEEFQGEIDELLVQMEPVEEGEASPPPPPPEAEEEEEQEFEVEFEDDEEEEEPEVIFEDDGDEPEVVFEDDGDEPEVVFEDDPFESDDSSDLSDSGPQGGDEPEVVFEDDDDDDDDDEPDTPPMSEEEEEAFLNSLGGSTVNTRAKAMQLTQTVMYRIANLKAKETKVDDVEALLSQAITTTDYAFAIKISNEALEKIEELEKECDSRFFQETAEKFHFARSQMIIAKTKGSDTEAAESLLEDASQAIARSDYGRADNLITRALKSLE